MQIKPNNVEGQEEMNIKEIISKLKPWGWFIIFCHIMVIGYYLTQVKNVTNDGVWNNAASYEQLKKEGLNWHNYIAYLFWVPTDTPGENPRQVVDEYDYANKATYLSYLTLWGLFVIFEIFVFFSFREGKSKFEFRILVAFMFIWLFWETTIVHQYIT